MAGDQQSGDRGVTARSVLSRRDVLTGGIGLAALLGLTGCVGTSAVQPKPSGPLNKPTTAPVRLTWYCLASPVEQGWAQDLATDFHKIHPNIAIDVVQNAQVGDIKTLITNDLSHRQPDILFSADTLSATEAEKGLLLDLNPYMDAYGYKQSDFVGKIMQLGQHNGHQYVLPRGVDQVVVGYNPDLFAKLKVPEPKWGWSWDEFKETSKALKRTVGGKQYNALGVGADYTGYPINFPFFKGWGGKLVNEAGSTAYLDSPEVVTGVTEMMDYVSTYSAQTVKPPVDPFLAGLAGMNWEIRPTVLGTMVNATRTKWTVPFVPKWVNFPLFPKPQIGAGMAGLGGSIQTKHPKETAAFLMYTISDRGQKLFSDVAGEVPVRNDLSSSPLWQKALNFGGKIDQRAFYAFGQYQSYPPQNAPMVSDGQIQEAIQNALDEIRLKKQTPAQAMKVANGHINSALKSDKAS